MILGAVLILYLQLFQHKCHGYTASEYSFECPSHTHRRYSVFVDQPSEKVLKVNVANLIEVCLHKPNLILSVETI